MTTKLTDAEKGVGFPPVPESAALALEYCLWTLERAGIQFTHGKTASHWHLVSTLSKHITPEEPKQ